MFFSASLLLLSMILCLNCFATSDQQYIYEIENQTIIFEENSAFDQETKQYIVECLANEYPDAVTYNLLCDLFGHKYETSETITCDFTFILSLSRTSRTVDSVTFGIYSLKLGYSSISSLKSEMGISLDPGFEGYPREIRAMLLS